MGTPGGRRKKREEEDEGEEEAEAIVAAAATPPAGGPRATQRRQLRTLYLGVLLDSAAFNILSAVTPAMIHTLNGGDLGGTSASFARMSAVSALLEFFLNPVWPIHWLSTSHTPSHAAPRCHAVLLPLSSPWPPVHRNIVPLLRRPRCSGRSPTTSAGSRSCCSPPPPRCSSAAWWPTGRLPARSSLGR